MRTEPTAGYVFVVVCVIYLWVRSRQAPIYFDKNDSIVEIIQNYKRLIFRMIEWSLNIDIFDFL